MERRACPIRDGSGWRLFPSQQTGKSLGQGAGWRLEDGLCQIPTTLAQDSEKYLKTGANLHQKGTGSIVWKVDIVKVQLLEKLIRLPDQVACEAFHAGSCPPRDEIHLSEGMFTQ